jgi:hypothetical protein
MDEDLKKRVDGMADELGNLPPEGISYLRHFVRRRSYSARLDAHRNTRDVSGIFNTCAKTELIVLSGRDLTDRKGKAIIPISEIWCADTIQADFVKALPEDTSMQIIEEPNFVATPLDNTPSFVTVQTQSTEVSPSGGGVVVVRDRQGNRLDRKPLIGVTVEVTTWRPDGSRAPRVSFSWICTIEVARVSHFSASG